MAMAEGLEDLKAMWQRLDAQIERWTMQGQPYLEIFEQAEAAYLFTDCEGVIEQVNGAAVDLFERRRRDLRGRPLAGLIAPAHRRDFQSRLGLLRTGTPGAASWRTRLRRGSSGELTVSARLLGRPPSGVGWALRPQP